MSALEKKKIGSIIWLVLGFAMLFVTFKEYQSYNLLGRVTSLKPELAMSGEGAIAMLIGYFCMAIVCFVFSYSFYRNK